MTGIAKLPVDPARCSWEPSGNALDAWEQGMADYRRRTSRDTVADKEWFTAMTVQPFPTPSGDGSAVCTNGVCIMTDAMMAPLSRDKDYPYMHGTPLDSKDVPDAVDRCTLNSDSYFYPIIRADGAIAFTAFNSNKAGDRGNRWMMMTPADADAAYDIDRIAEATVESMLFEDYYDEEESHIPNKDYDSYRMFRSRRYQSKAYRHDSYRRTEIWGNVFGYYTKHVGEDYNGNTGVFRLIEDSPSWQRTMTRMMFSVINSLSPFDGQSLLLGNSHNFQTTETGWSWFLSLYSDIEHDVSNGCRTVLDRGAEYGPGWYALAMLYPILDSNYPHTGTFDDSENNRKDRRYFIRVLSEIVDPYPYRDDDDKFDDDIRSNMKAGCRKAGELGLPAALWPECVMAMNALSEHGLPYDDERLLKSLLATPLQSWWPMLGFMRLWFGYENMHPDMDDTGRVVDDERRMEPEYKWDCVCEQIVHQGLGGLSWYEENRLDEVRHGLSVYADCLRRRSCTDDAVSALDWLVAITDDSDSGKDIVDDGSYHRDRSWDYRRMADAAIAIRNAASDAPVRSLWSKR